MLSIKITMMRDINKKSWNELSLLVTAFSFYTFLDNIPTL